MLGAIAFSGAAGLVGAAALTSCTSHVSSSPSRTTYGSTTSSSQSTTTSSASSVTPGTSTCQVNSLTLGLEGRSGAAGTVEWTFDLRNASTSSCVLLGFPGAQMLDVSGTPLTIQTTLRGGGYAFTNLSPTKVTLEPGSTAYFNVGYSDVPTGSESTCPSSSRLAVTPPNDFSQLAITFQAAVCNHGTLTVSPVFGPGSPETQTTAPPSS